MQFKIPALPPSDNVLYGINYRKRCKYMTREGREFAMLVKKSTPPFSFKEQQPLIVSVEFHGAWYNKGNKKIKKKDVQNLGKCLFDAIFEKGGVDDSHAWECSFLKVQDEEVYTLVNIEEA